MGGELWEENSGLSSGMYEVVYGWRTLDYPQACMSRVWVENSGLSSGMYVWSRI